MCDVRGDSVGVQGSQVEATGLSGLFGIIWLPPRDSNPDNLLQRQVSYH